MEKSKIKEFVKEHKNIIVGSIVMAVGVTLGYKTGVKQTEWRIARDLWLMCQAKPDFRDALTEALNLAKEKYSKM